jgi:hypothetical protein
MSNNLLIGLGIIGILGTGSAAVVANTQALVDTNPSPLIEASDVLLPDPTGTTVVIPSEVAPEPVPSSGAGAPSDAVSSNVQDAPQLSTPSARVAPVTPASVDATSSGSSYSESDADDESDDDDEGDDDDNEGDEEAGEDDDYEDDDDDD